MTDSPSMADLANLAPRITGAINQMRTFAFFLTNYVDDYRRLPTRNRLTMETIRFQIDRLIEITDNLRDDLTVAKELAR